MHLAHPLCTEVVFRSGHCNEKILVAFSLLAGLCLAALLYLGPESALQRAVHSSVTMALNPEVGARWMLSWAPHQFDWHATDVHVGSQTGGPSLSLHSACMAYCLRHVRAAYRVHGRAKLPLHGYTTYTQCFARANRFYEPTDYWDATYQNNIVPCETLRGFKDLQCILNNITDGNTDISILHVGCGNSLLTESIYDHGFHNIVNVDKSPVVINQMRKRNTGLRPAMQWLVGDALRMKLADRQFGLVIDKAVLDDLESQVERSDSRYARGSAPCTFLEEVTRVLKDDGVYLCVSASEPASRLPYFQSAPTDFHIEVVVLQAKDVQISPGCFMSYGITYCYICRRKRNQPLA
eukprot:gnl/MRDRNA2_/MRDRNA2_67539_c0_seq1.p1 gnl/MRDRNA2_/MRDRNA2_67539_c0~~gnl/MRDRNA2_/MRDRNA2_67539_c0_seq1.p1  ORF type:complete len:362 (-),score=43.03 gnl/MRDRNA2_/MRDRNA2_67539_c0_seq1:106-1158(-)